jgi:ATP-dependent protease HslVU (ClpYQ) peptidase subunit
MTTIAFRSGVIAADSGLSMGSSRMSSGMVKIARNKAGDLAGVVGHASFCAGFLEWFKAGEDERCAPRRFSEDRDQAMIVRRNGKIEMHDGGGVYEVQAEYFAIGSGRPEAMGAMFVGANAETAVRAAVALDGNNFGEVMSLRADGVIVEQEDDTGDAVISYGATLPGEQIIQRSAAA